jgi:hypothetical protein
LWLTSLWRREDGSQMKEFIPELQFGYHLYLLVRLRIIILNRVSRFLLIDLFSTGETVSTGYLFLHLKRRGMYLSRR